MKKTETLGKQKAFWPSMDKTLTQTRTVESNGNEEIKVERLSPREEKLAAHHFHNEQMQEGLYGIPAIKKVYGITDYKIMLNAECTVDVLPRLENQGTKAGLKYDRKNKASDGYKFRESSKKTLRNRISAYFMDAHAQRQKLTWATFTVPELRPDFEGKIPKYNAKIHDQMCLRALRNMLELLRKRHGLIDYIVVSERQKNGKIHFHAILVSENVFPVRIINALWLRKISFCQAMPKRYKGYFRKVGKGKDMKRVFVSEKQIVEAKLKVAEMFKGNPMSFGSRNKEMDIEVKTEWLRKIRRAYLDWDQDYFLMSKVDSLFSVRPDWPILTWLNNAVDLEPIEKGEKGFSKLRNYMTKYITKNARPIRAGEIVSENDKTRTTFFCRPFICTRGFSQLQERVELSMEQYLALVKKWKPVEREYLLEIGDIRWIARKLWLDHKFVNHYKKYLPKVESTEEIEVVGKGDKCVLTGEKITEYSLPLSPENVLLEVMTKGRYSFENETGGYVISTLPNNTYHIRKLGVSKPLFVGNHIEIIDAIKEIFTY